VNGHRTTVADLRAAALVLEPPFRCNAHAARVRPRRSLPPSGLLQVRLMWPGQPVRSRQTLVDGFLASPQRVDVGTIGGEAGRDLGTLGNGAVAWHYDI